MSSPERDLDPVSELVAACLARIEREGPGALERFLEEHAEHADVVRRRVVALATSGLLPEDADDVPERLGEYRLLDPLGGGGMGLVYRARQESLGREVAVKLIRPDHLVFPDARARFRREVEVIARLQHPGIVPVYAFGEERGTPYFVMELVHGATLGEVIAELHGRDPATLEGADLSAALRALLDRRGGGSIEIGGELFERAYPHACAELVRRAAEALEHAHRGGVLHRDLKPSNLFLTADGRALLFDFGLSRAEWLGSLTRSGTLLGSLPYLPPEQVRGRGADRRSDVYGLGVVLYELLALRTPFGDERAVEVQQAILAGHCASVRARNPAVPRDVALVCERAMDRDPERRYATAGALASDLANALALRPVEARPAGPGLRLKRWSQRNPARAAAVALLFLLVVVAPTAFGLERLRAARRLATEVQRAEGNLDTAVGALIDLAGHVGSESLDRFAGTNPLRAQILTSARERLEELAPQLGADPKRLKDRARLAKNLARVQSDLGKNALALETYEEAVAEFEALRGRDDVERLDWDLGATLVETALVRYRLGDMEGYVATMERGVELMRAAWRAEPDEPRLALALGKSLTRIGEQHMIRTGVERARPWLEEGIARLQDALAADPTADVRRALASALGKLAVGEVYLGDLAQGLERAARARALFDALLSEDPTDWHARTKLMELLAQLSQTFPGRKDWDVIEADARAGLALQSDLAVVYPRDPEIARQRPFLLQNLCAVLSVQRRQEEAVEVAAEAADAAREFADAGDGSDPTRLEILGRGLGLYSVLLRDVGRMDEARQVGLEALALAERRYRSDPTNRQLGYSYGMECLIQAKLALLIGETIDLDELRPIVEGPLRGYKGGYYMLAQLGCMLSERSEGEESAEHLDVALGDLRSALQAGYRFGDNSSEAEDLAPLRAHPGWGELGADE